MLSICLPNTNVWGCVGGLTLHGYFVSTCIQYFWRSSIYSESFQYHLLEVAELRWSFLTQFKRDPLEDYSCLSESERLFDGHYEHKDTPGFLCVSYNRKSLSHFTFAELSWTGSAMVYLCMFFFFFSVS